MILHQILKLNEIRERFLKVKLFTFCLIIFLVNILGLINIVTAEERMIDIEYTNQEKQTLEQAQQIQQAQQRQKTQHTWQDNPEGFLWYNEQAQQEIKKQKNNKKQKPIVTREDSKEPHDIRIDNLKKQFNRAQRIALDNPTLENVVTAQRIQKQIMDKSQKFATMWQLATILDYQLTNAKEPANSLHKRLYQDKIAHDNTSRLKQLSNNWGLILQISHNCSYCVSFAPIVKEFSKKYNFQLLAVSDNGGDFNDIAGMKDTGFLNKLNPEKIVPVLYLASSDGKKIYPIARGLINEENIIENIIALDTHYQNLNSYKSSQAKASYEKH